MWRLRLVLREKEKKNQEAKARKERGGIGKVISQWAKEERMSVSKYLMAMMSKLRPPMFKALEPPTLYNLSPMEGLISSSKPNH